MSTLGATNLHQHVTEGTSLIPGSRCIMSWLLLGKLDQMQSKLEIWYRQQTVSHVEG